MLLDKCMIAVCPHCNKKKELMQLMSGNTFGAVSWSDCKLEAPMLPKVSPVQKCPECGHFFLLGDTDITEGDVESMETGWLDFEDAVKAMDEICETHKDDDDILEMLMVNVVWAYNDIYRRGDVPTDIQTEVFRDVVSRSLEHNILKHNILLRAELFREMGNFEECIRLLRHGMPSDSYLLKIRNQIINKAESKDSKLFKTE